MQNFWIYVIAGGTGSVCVGSAYLAFKKVFKLSDEQALQRASVIAWKLLQFYQMELPKAAVDGIQPEEVFHFGAKMLGLVLGELKDPGLSPELRKAHPELAAVDAFTLGEALVKQKVISEGVNRVFGRGAQ